MSARCRSVRGSCARCQLKMVPRASSRKDALHDSAWSALEARLAFRTQIHQKLTAKKRAMLASIVVTVVQ